MECVATFGIVGAQTVSIGSVTDADESLMDEIPDDNREESRWDTCCYPNAEDNMFRRLRIRLAMLILAGLNVDEEVDIHAVLHNALVWDKIK